MMWPFSLFGKPNPAPKPIENLVTDTFNVSKGWRDELGRIEVLERGHHEGDGNPIITLKVGDITCLVFQQAEEFVATTPGAEPFRWDKVCMVRQVEGVEVADPNLILRDNFDTHGYPCIGADEDGRLSLHMAFPVVQNMPLDAVRAQVKMAAVVVYNAELAIVRECGLNERRQEERRPSFDLASFARQAALFALYAVTGEDTGTDSDA